MAKVKTPNQKNKYRELNKRLAKYVLLVENIYERLNLESAKIALSTGYEGGDRPFKFSNYPQTRDKVNKLKAMFVNELQTLIYSGTTDEWKQSNLVQDLLADRVLKTYGAKIDGKKYKVYYQTNSDALKAFQTRKDDGMGLSAKLWNQAANYRQEMEYAISSAIQKGTSAVTLSKRLSKYLQDFPRLKKEYKDKFGKAVDCHDCEYRSIRLARSEINMAYRTAEQTRWEQMDFIVGYEIKTSHAHKVKDVCDDLVGRYPKDFKWTGWHPNCYSEDSSVLTDNGWKLFKEVENNDLILSLNPETKALEYVPFVARQVYEYNGKMLRFSNKSLDCLVTEDHKMVYLNKHDSKIKTCTARDYTKGKGAFYRGCEYEANEIDSIEIGGEIYNFDDYCEFMGYYLADGSLSHNSGVILSQKEGEPARKSMLDLVKRLGFAFFEKEYTIEFYKASLNRYLSRFGKSYQKFIPDEILNASRRQIHIFLNAFILCDGYKRPSRTFVGNRGSVFSTSNDERMYFTTSKRMAGGICELLLKIGKRPSLRENKLTEHVYKGKTIKANYPCVIISECSSLTASVFNKEEVDYSGKVYDLTLEKNHIMYISRNGKCFWGSNCMDYVVPILNTEDEFWSDSIASVNEVKDVPEGFKKWIESNDKRIIDSKASGTLPYFVKDNPSVLRFAERSYETRQVCSIANSVKGEVQGLAESVANKYGALVTPVNLKTRASILRKAELENISPFELKDTVRTTIIADKDSIGDVIKDLAKDDSFLRLKVQRSEDFMGYSGNIVNIKTSAGLIGEIQVNTAKMIYAKEKPEDAKRILGESLWNRIRNEVKVEGGLGHKFYEEARVLNKASEKFKEIVEKSIAYYSNFQ